MLHSCQKQQIMQARDEGGGKQVAGPQVHSCQWQQLMQARDEGGLSDQFFLKQVAGPQVQLQGLREGMPLTLGGLPQPPAPPTALPEAAVQLEPDTRAASGTPAADIDT